ncbi:hypothetical protein L1987_50175 [Smallanthus sonchifolius]|uniref:Uncharacterized protein n=1 Tax=Smallanthus sonchifolius TaxID=185202 RepID=A0ACB9FXS1_9ASTR|nr:hypothetical protein L1987_50175 [Smallanthus sonchifolius]
MNLPFNTHLKTHPFFFLTFFLTQHFLNSTATPEEFEKTLKSLPKILSPFSSKSFHQPSNRISHGRRSTRRFPV